MNYNTQNAKIASITEKWLGDDMTKRIIPEDTQE